MPSRNTLGLRLGPRRVSFILVALGLFALFTLFITLPSAIPTGPSLSKSLADHKVSIPKLKGSLSSSNLNPFKPASHPPPEQKNSTYAGSSWYAHWNWLNPFSSAVTLDENRAVLPPLKERTSIYCYYDTTVQRDQSTKDAESELLLTWRRAWWAQGLKPIILSPAEAMNNPLYDELQRLELEPGFKRDLMRWLAWENMGGGLISHSLLFPMGSRQDPLLTFLRRGEFPSLTRWEGLDEALFAGSKSEIAAAVTQAMRSPAAKKPKSLIQAVSPDKFSVDSTHDSLAFYDVKTVETKYAEVAKAIEGNRGEGLKSLNGLVNSHLHLTWQATFDQGIAVLKPLPEHTTRMVKPAQKLAKLLASCNSAAPLPSSCPPNRPKCTPCATAKPMKIATLNAHKNATGLYTIGTVPHPYTFQSLHLQRDDLDVPFLRRESQRDLWLITIFDGLNKGKPQTPRLIQFKEAVAGDHAVANSIWLTAERETDSHDLDWWFGFEAPRAQKGNDNDDDDDDDNHKSGGALKPETPDGKPQEPVKSEAELLKKAKAIGKSKADPEVRLRGAFEAWNMKDTEAWRFSRAFMSRSTVERLKWEQEESKYAGGVGSDKHSKPKSSWSRWTDFDEFTEDD